ncbi:ArsR/SmtB family transcription factor [Halobacillus campisalis]|uniref:ArsR/SmtB family transcription factor n=1 Tax=Halobacillus campisalis TaxID=435909 RepID=A0ABW2JZH0_9BACI|nr:metalloregulator ArsR/SmtB family transcription factor [Halobacillus campisalis]
MNVIQSNYKRRETYHVTIEHSILFECALGIAAITNKPLLDTLEKKDWPTGSFSPALRQELATVEKNNTWKSLLQLLHQESFQTLQQFTDFIDHLPEEQLKFICLPYLGESFQEKRAEASKGQDQSIHYLKKEVEDHPFFAEYISFISSTDPIKLKTHLQTVMNEWYEAVIQPEEQTAVLERDHRAKEKMLANMEPEAFIEWATGGIQYPAEPSVYRVLLIPHMTYRPWNVEADLEGTKVFYYPVSNDSLHSNDPYTPDQFVVQKYKALGDEVRLKIIKYLFEQERTLQELTGLLEMGKSTIHHHLKMLKAARIVESSHSTYRLKKQTIDMMGAELEQFLGRK